MHFICFVENLWTPLRKIYGRINEKSRAGIQKTLHFNGNGAFPQTFSGNSPFPLNSLIFLLFQWIFFIFNDFLNHLLKDLQKEMAFHLLKWKRMIFPPVRGKMIECGTRLEVGSIDISTPSGKYHSFPLKEVKMSHFLLIFCVMWIFFLRVLFNVFLMYLLKDYRMKSTNLQENGILCSLSVEEWYLLSIYYAKSVFIFLTSFSIQII